MRIKQEFKSFIRGSIVKQRNVRESVSAPFDLNYSKIRISQLSNARNAENPI